jgi:hypothetical protein
MTITIPAWLIWTTAIVIGVPLIVAVLACAWIGWKVATTWGPPRW